MASPEGAAKGEGSMGRREVALSWGRGLQTSACPKPCASHQPAAADRAYSVI